jgi:hypothetical protein
MTPRMNPSLSPPFHQLDEYTFQRLCCELHARQLGIATCAVYGTRGQRQRGIDLLAHRRGSTEKEIGQCKCYEDFPPAEIRKASEEFLEHLEYWQQHRLFAALLDFVNDEFGHWADAVRWPASIKLAMVWAHTNILHNLFGRLQMDPDKLAQWIEKARRRTSAEILGRNLASWNDVLHPRRQNRTAFLVHAVAPIVASYDSHLIEDLSVKDLLLTTAFTGDHENRSPQMSLLHDLTLASNALDSFLGGDWFPVLAPCIGHELSARLASSSLKSIVKEAIQNLKNDPFQQSEWAKIAVVVGNLPMYEDLAAEFKEVVRQLNFTSLDMINPSTAMLALRVALDQAIHLNDEAFRLYCETGLLEMIKAQVSRDNGSANPDIDLFLDDAVELSIRPSDVRATSKAFSKLLQSMFEA